MQYCKNCGRQLKDGMRFCDRCGQSVRKAQESGQTARHREIRELQEERLNRKKHLEEKERKQQRIKEKRRKNNNGCLFVGIIVLIVVACLSVYIGHRLGQSSSSTNNTDNPSMLATSEPTVTPGTAAVGDYKELVVGNIRCPYPSSFKTSGTVSGDVKLSVSDSLGGAKMVIAQEARTEGPMELAKEYIAQIGAGAQDTMKKGDDWYSVTASVNGTVDHRKCIVRKGLAVYYDFEYSESSGSAATYEGYIEEIDKNFK